LFVCFRSFVVRSDAKLVVGDKIIDVHKLVLSARSPVFAAMFASKMSEAKSGQVVIDDMELPVVKEMIR
jgi:speckle-type POZ protein